MKKFVAISVLLHLVVLFFIFLKWEEKPRMEWGGGEEGAIFIELQGAERGKSPPAPLFQRGEKSFPESNYPPLSAKGRISPSAEKRGGRSGSETPTSGAAEPLIQGDFSGGSNDGIGDGYDTSSQKSDNILALIRQRIERAKVYPLTAKKQGIQGTVMVKFLMAKGAVSSVSVTRTSGSALLDNEAVATVKRAQPYPDYDGEITLGLKFDLEE